MPIRAWRGRELLFQGIQALAELALVFRYFGKQSSGFRRFLRGHAPVAVEIYRIVSHAVTVRSTRPRFSASDAAAAGALFREALRPQPCQLPRTVHPFMGLLQAPKPADKAGVLPRMMRLDLPFIVGETFGAKIDPNLFAHAPL